MFVSVVPHHYDPSDEFIPVLSPTAICGRGEHGWCSTTGTPNAGVRACKCKVSIAGSRPYDLVVSGRRVSKTAKVMHPVLMPADIVGLIWDRGQMGSVDIQFERR